MNSASTARSDSRVRATTEVASWADAFVTDERRAFTRRRRHLLASLTWAGCGAVIDGLTDDVSESGLRLCVSRDASLRVGMRCEVSLRESGADGAEPLIDGVFATVLRTERVGDESEPKVVVGLRFDQPLYL